MSALLIAAVCAIVYEPTFVVLSYKLESCVRHARCMMQLNDWHGSHAMLTTHLMQSMLAVQLAC
jgi:hypothetical protein